ncbi:MAG: 5-oxoprolinase subunit PxpA [Methylophaga sp.]|nr:5-oxoprolinase subunit PxpA [Methylophaga sp.]
MKLINCDLGECLIPSPDEDVMPLIDMANIACGGHAGDESSMIEAIKQAQQHGVKIGVHPSYPDKDNFGRLSYRMSSIDLFQLIYKQVVTFQALCDKHGVRIEYIKPHGALYHDMMHKEDVLMVLCNVIETLDSSLSLMVQAGINTETFERFSKDKDIQFLYEAFADRGYRGLQMIPRSEQGAMLEDAQHIVEQYHSFCQEQTAKIDTICFHSDNPSSVLALKILRAM